MREIARNLGRLCWRQGLFGTLLLLCAPSLGLADERPNFVFLFADDLGWGDLGSYGNRRLMTSNIDRLAREGILFTQFYVAGSVCSPSRAAIMTGRFPARLGVHGHFGSPGNNKARGMKNFLDPAVMTITRLLQQNGYVTGHFGKWHLGAGWGAPLLGAYGISESISNLSNDPRALTTFNHWKAEKRPVAAKETLDAAYAFIQKHRDRPFYVNVWFIDPHATLNPSDAQMKFYRRYSPGSVRHRGAWQIYYAAVNQLDTQIGLFVEKLKRLGIADNTLIIFASDNGPEDIFISNASHSGVGSTGPFRGRKRSIYEGGVRVPFIVRWPKATPAGRVDDSTVISGVDFLPTICALAGIELPVGLKLDGEDMSAALRGRPQTRTKPLMWEWRYEVYGHPINRSPVLAIREGRWKLLVNPDGSRTELYDIPADPSEMNNLAASNPGLVKRLSRKVLSWQETLPKTPLDSAAGVNTYPWPKAAPPDLPQ